MRYPEFTLPIEQKGYCRINEDIIMIWQQTPDLAALNDRGKNTMSDYLGIEIIDFGDDFMKATMSVNQYTKQPIGIMHGGASCVLAETIGSTAANTCVNIETHYCVGLDFNTNHIRAVTSGTVTAIAKPFHIGKSSHVWHIEIHNDKQQLVSVSRLTMAVLKR